MNEIKGIILIDKPKGKTSPEITAEISEKLDTKTGHCGALDPYATGILPITIGKAVKIQEYLQRKDKEYLVEIETEGEISTEKMKRALNKFQGKIIQMPPEKSAVKRRKREREIYSIKHIGRKGKIHIFEVKCQHGTYIRTLVKDLSEKLNIEIKLKNLRRTKTGKWKEEDTYTIEEINRLIDKKELKKVLITIEETLEEFPKIEIKKTALKPISHGEDLKIPGIKQIQGKIEKGEEVILTQEKEAIAIGETQKELSKKDKGTKGKAVKVKKVLIDSL